MSPDPAEIEFLEGVDPVQPETGEQSPGRLSTLVLVVVGLCLAILATVPFVGGSTVREPEAASATPDSAAELDGPAVALWPNVEALPDASAVDRPTVIVTLNGTPRRSEPRVHVVADGELDIKTLDTIVWFGTPLLEWPGDSPSPFVQTEQHLVYPSDGDVWAQDLALESEPVPLLPGVLVIPGPQPSSVWVIASGGASVTPVDVSNAAIGTTYSARELGFPRAAFSDGLIVDPSFEANIEGLALWRPDEPLEELPVDPGLDLLGVGGDRLVFGDGASLTTYDIDSGELSTVPLGDRRQIRRSAVSPDGRFVALAQRPDLVSFSTLEVFDTSTGELLDALGPVVEWHFGWSDDERLLTVTPSEMPGLWEVVERSVVARKTTSLASMDGPIVWFAAQSPP